MSIQKNKKENFDVVGFSDDTEILTKDGWKMFCDVSGGDCIITLNTNSLLMEYHKPINILSWKYNGDMILHDSQAINFCVTPNKQMLTLTRGSRIKSYVTAQELFNKPYRILKTGRWVGGNINGITLPEVKSKTRKYPEKYINIDKWLIFLGLYLSEGYSTIPKNRSSQYIVGVCQSPSSKFYDYIKESLKDIFGNYQINGSNITKRDKQLYKYLEQFGKAHDKFIPIEIKSLNSELLSILFYNLMVGDGSFENKQYSTCSRKLADDMQEIALKLGFSASIFEAYTRGFKQYYVQFQKSRTKPQINQRKRCCKDELISYNGKIFNIEVPNNTIYVRRKGKACWFPNYKSGSDFEREAASLAGKWGRRTPRSGAIGTTEHFSALCGDATWKFPWLKKPIIIEAKHGYGDKNKKVKSIRIQKEWFDKHLKAAKDNLGEFVFYPAFAMKLKFTTENGMSKFMLIPFSTMRRIITDMENTYIELEELRAEVKKLKKR